MRTDTTNSGKRHVLPAGDQGRQNHTEIDDGVQTNSWEILQHLHVAHLRAFLLPRSALALVA